MSATLFQIYFWYFWTVWTVTVVTHCIRCSSHMSHVFWSLQCTCYYLWPASTFLDVHKVDVIYERALRLFLIHVATKHDILTRYLQQRSKQQEKCFKGQPCPEKLIFGFCCRNLFLDLFFPIVATFGRPRWPLAPSTFYFILRQFLLCSPSFPPPLSPSLSLLHLRSTSLLC